MKRLTPLLSSLFQDQGFLVVVANACDSAYAKGVGHPEYHPADFTVDEWDPNVRRNLPALFAVDAVCTRAAHVDATLEDGHICLNADTYMDKLRWIASLGDKEFNVEDLMAPALFEVVFEANVTWRQSNAGEGMKRIARPVGRHYSALLDEKDAEEIRKDLLQVVTAAKTLLEKLESNS